MKRSVFEVLENRRLLSATMVVSNDVLVVTGTSGPDTLTASEAGGMLTLKLNGKHKTFDTGNFSQIEISMAGGNDYVRLGSSVDRPAKIMMGDGNDYALGTSMHDVMYGGNGNDRLNGGGGPDVIWGGRGNDYCYGDGGNDSLHGDAGHNHLYGNGGNDVMYGMHAYDHLYGGNGSNNMRWGNMSGMM